MAAGRATDAAWGDGRVSSIDDGARRSVRRRLSPRKSGLGSPRLEAGDVALPTADLPLDVDALVRTKVVRHQGLQAFQDFSRLMGQHGLAQRPLVAWEHDIRRIVEHRESP